MRRCATENQKNSKAGNQHALVPLCRWAYEMDLNVLLCFRDIVPLAIRLPTGRNDLYQDFPLGNLRRLSDSLLVGLDIQLRQLAFFGLMIFRELNVYAGLCDMLIIVAARDFDAEPGLRLISVGHRRRSTRRHAGSNQEDQYDKVTGG